jgi:tRNA threonylcarbamoyl adenosine modification protein (Sua5/YciO/YrdC/YwlC family)
MAQYFEIHPDNPQLRLIHRAVQIIEQGGVIAYPTDSSYAIACHIGDRQALDKIRRIRQLDDKHNFTLVCENMAQVSIFSKVSNDAYRLIKNLTPGPFTFILKATREVPKKLQHRKRKTVGIRIPGNSVAHTLLQELDEPLFSSTLILPGKSEALIDPYQIREHLEHELDLIIDVGIVDYEPTTIIDVAESSPNIIRQGKGLAPMLD